MVYVSEKEISGRKYVYLVKSIRGPGGAVLKLQKLLKAKPENLKAAENENREYFSRKEKEAYVRWAERTYKNDSVFTTKAIEKTEHHRMDYKNVLSKLSDAQIRDMLDRFTANFTYESNALEGNSLTLKDVSMVMFDNRTIEGKDLREIYETRNSRKVMELIYKKKFDVSETSIIRMHKLLVKDIRTPGGYKKVPNFLLGRSVRTTPPEKVKREMTELLKWLTENSQKLHPLQLAARFHGRFEKIHPFEDGNGRVGRFLVNVILINNNYPPLIVRKTQRQAYLKALEDFDRNYTPNLERFFLEKFKQTFKQFFEVYLKYL
ncbi:MAG: Fic family protein [Candidatus Diapherotrites archaeon]|nr:Fic family protein [Candidatus Diapherotrites archaeon]